MEEVEGLLKGLWVLNTMNEKRTETVGKTPQERPTSTLIVSLFEQVLKTSCISSYFIQFNPSQNTKVKVEEEQRILTADDWDLLVNGTKLKSYAKGEIIVQQGEEYQKLFHIVKGTCRIEKDEKGEKKV